VGEEGGQRREGEGEEKEREGYWEDVRSVMGLLTTPYAANARSRRPPRSPRLRWGSPPHARRHHALEIKQGRRISYTPAIRSQYKKAAASMGNIPLKTPPASPTVARAGSPTMRVKSPSTRARVQRGFTSASTSQLPLNPSPTPTRPSFESQRRLSADASRPSIDSSRRPSVDSPRRPSVDTSCRIHHRTHKIAILTYPPALLHPPPPLNNVNIFAPRLPYSAKKCVKHHLI
jgi:hypothetical protein